MIGRNAPRWAGRWGQVRGIAIAAIWGVLLVGCAGENDSDTTGAELTVGLVFDVGGRGDKSFNDAAYRGLQWARDSLGVAFEIYEPTEGSDREAGLCAGLCCCPVSLPGSPIGHSACPQRSSPSGLCGKLCGRSGRPARNTLSSRWCE